MGRAAPAAATWDRQPGETEAAHAAFRAFRDMGAGRSVIGAYRRQKGIKGASKASGEWSRLVKAHDWHARALAWDNHRDAVATRAADRALERVASKWVARSDAQAEADFAFSQKYAAEMARRLNDAELLRLMPARDLKACIAVTTAASGLAWAAISSQLPALDVDFDPDTATTEQLTAAIERLDAALGTPPRAPRIARPD